MYSIYSAAQHDPSASAGARHLQEGPWVTSESVQKPTLERTLYVSDMRCVPHILTYFPAMPTARRYQALQTLAGNIYRTVPRYLYIYNIYIEYKMYKNTKITKLKLWKLYIY